MTTTTQKPSKAVVPIGESAIQKFDPNDLSRAFMAALPGGGKLSTDQAFGLAIAAQTGDRNPFSGEMQLIPGIGARDAAKSTLADFNEWIERRGDFAEWKYNENVLPEVRARYGLEDRDLIVEVQLNLKSARDAWREKGEALRAWGVPWQDIVKELGMQPPSYTCYGIVRFNEQKDSKDGDKKTAEQKWAEMDAKYARIERAKKRGRSAIIVSVCPVTTSQRRRAAKELRQAESDPTKFVSMTGKIVDALTPDQAARGKDAVWPKGEGYLMDDDAPEHAATDVIDGVVAQTATAAPDIEDDIIEGDEAVSEPAPEKPIEWPASIVAAKAALDAAAQRYSYNGRATSEKQDGLIMMHLQILTNKDDDMRRVVTKALTGFEHFADLPGPFRLAILNDWLKLRPNPNGNGKTIPCVEAVDNVKVIIATTGQQVLIA